MNEETKPRSAAAEREEKILAFWRVNDVFSETLKKDSPKGEFVFFEGPPTANGKPGIHHLEARAFKDAIPRYKTMQGFHVRRKGGWDTHGLPVELQVEKALGLNSKKAIVEFGIAKFNDKCKESVWEYLGIWEKFTERIGYWVDQKDPYVTYHNPYIESVWNVFSKIHDKGLLYKDYRIVPWCPRCGTALSSHELAQGYQDDKDLSVTAKFKVVGEDNTYILAWTTTPWTLPGNVALAVGSDIEYVKVKNETETLILAEARMSVLPEGYTVVKKVKGSELVGLEYEPLYPYLSGIITEAQKENLKKAFKVYAADFVTTEDGTGVVHTAVMYGADDFELGTKLGLPKQHIVLPDGTFVKGTDFLEGRFVKDEAVAVDIIKDLAHRGLLFKKEKYEHSYPHCWRCKTPLIYYARDSWYIRMSEPSVKNALIEENKKINWEPEYIQAGRFGEWLKDIKDWAISRERYWGTPMPIWTTASGKLEVVGSLDDLKKKMKRSGNTYLAMRHGEAEHNLYDLCNFKNQVNTHLTDNGKQQVAASAELLKKENIDYIFVSPFARTQETAKMVKDILGLGDDKVIVDDRLIELNPGTFDGQTWTSYREWANSQKDRYTATPENGESRYDAKIRLGAFLYDIETKFQNKNILIVSHGISLETFPAILEGANNDRSFMIYGETSHKPGMIMKLDFVPLPHNESYELDLHRPYIDTVELVSDTGEPMTRVKEVMDVWFDSGAMPFAQDHYPFENKEWVDGPGYPADFISEAIDQTRGWFYTLHAVGMLMGRGRAYKNVICLGHILDAEGKKMSKSLGNIVDPWAMMEKYGVDTLRLWMYSVNQPGESKNFDEKTVAELHNKVFNLLYNVLAFYELYRDTSLETPEIPKSANVLDAWILARLGSLTLHMTEHLDRYKLLEPVRAVREFIDDLSTWYVRRSRDRMKDGDTEAKQTLYFVLKTMAKLLAPFAPFAAEDIWQKLKHGTDVSSVHMAEWPRGGETDAGVLEKMRMLRDVVTMGLKARQAAQVPVRQPLASIQVVAAALEPEYVEILKDELNVRGAEFASGETLGVTLDMNITPELKREGEYRELVRAVQDMRKKEGLTPSDPISLTLPGSAQTTVGDFETELKKAVLAVSVTYSGDAIVVQK